MKKTAVGIAVAVVVAGGAGFYGGMQYGKSAAPEGLAGFRNLSPGERTEQLGRRGAFPGGGGVAGEIVGKDAESITVKLSDGGSKIVFFSASTRVAKLADGTPSDLAVGEQVVVSGTANADGSVTAQSIQLRPAESGPLR